MHRLDVYAVTAFIKFDFAINQSKQGPIAASADVVTGDKLGAALTNNDAAGGDELATEPFDAQALTDAVATISNASLTFFMCHNFIILYPQF